MSSLPKYIALKDVNVRAKIKQYLGVSDEGLLEYWYPIVSERAKFEVVVAKSGKGLVHLRSCFNHKYLVSKAENGDWIVARGKEANEEQEKWDATVWKVNGSSSTTVEFSNRQLTFKGQVVDYSTVVILPEKVAFMGDNEKYLGAYYQSANNMNHMRFGEDDLGSEYVPNEISTDNDGNVRIKSTYFGKYWRRMDSDYIAVDHPTGDDPECWFKPVYAGEGLVAFSSLTTGRFMQRFVDDKSFVKLNVKTITRQAQFKVVEPVLKRSVRVINYRTDEARVYDLSPITLQSETVPNPTNIPQEAPMSFKYTDSSTSSWNNNFTIKAGVTTSFEAGVPLVGAVTVEISVETSYTHEWGGSVTSTKEHQTTFNLTVPPRTAIKVSLLATRGKCDVPFSYVQTDYLTNGRVITRTLHDGLFKGVNSFDFTYQMDPVPLSQQEWIG